MMNFLHAPLTFVIAIFHAVTGKINNEEIVFIGDTSKIVCGTKNLTLSTELIHISYWVELLIPIGQ
jgi:hypothetical protein